MGIMLNLDNAEFQKAVNSEIYVDKTELIQFTNSKINTLQGNICVSRPKRFGKSMAADMLVAYYSKGCDSRDLFSKYKIAEDENFEKHLNKYNVIHINIQRFLERSKGIEGMIALITRKLIKELKKEFADVDFDEEDLMFTFSEIYNATKTQFIFIIYEWDSVMRDKKFNADEQTDYLNFLRDLLKVQSYYMLTYMTGILPIKKYGQHSAINMFHEYSIIEPEPMERFNGFTEDEVKALCKEHNIDFSEMKKWYDGYDLNGMPIYNPKSVVECILRNKFSNYWTSTETYEALKFYIQMDFDDLRSKVIKLIAGESIVINPDKFQNDMTTFKSSDDVLTLLVHLGYLTFDFATNSVRISNNEM